MGYIISVENSLEKESHRLVESVLNITTKNTNDFMSLSSRRKNISYLIEWTSNAFVRGLLGFNQVNPSKNKISLFLFWKVLYDITQISEATLNKFEAFVIKLRTAKWGIVSVNYITLDTTSGELDTDFVDNGACISVCFSKKKVEPLSECIYMNIFKDKIVFKSRIGMRINEDYLNTILSVTGEYPYIFDETMLISNDRVIDKSSSIFEKFSKNGEISSAISLFPIELSSLEIKSAKTRKYVNSMLTSNELKFKHHVIGLKSMKNMPTYDYVHTAEIDVHDNMTGAYIDTVYIIDNVVYFRSSFRCEDVGDIFSDVSQEYGGMIVYDVYSSFFYYKMKQRDQLDIFIDASGLEFKLELFFANV